MRVEDIWRRQGTVRIGREVLREFSVDLAEEIFSNLIVVRTELLAHDDSFEIQAISREFDKVEVGVEPPEYVAVIENDDSEDRLVKFERREDEFLSLSSVDEGLLKDFWEHELKKCDTEEEIEDLCDEYNLMITEAKTLNARDTFKPTLSPFERRRFVPKPKISYHIESKPNNNIDFETYITITCGVC